MTIVVPIHVAALRVSPSGSERVKTALYDFSVLGRSPLSSGGHLIAADRFLHAEDSLSREPGIHLHWSLPRAYTRGEQRNTDGALIFPSLPNRWLVTRFFRDLNGGATSIASWILEADAHAADAGTLGSAGVTMPWMNATDDLYGLGFHYIGRRIPLTDSWREPGAPVPGVSYLGPLLQAPLAYGPTFTAYYRQCRNLFGLYDDLTDVIPDASRLEAGCRFVASYSVTGWVSPQLDDAAGLALQAALHDYDTRPADDAAPFATYLQTAVESGLGWRLDDYGVLTAEAASSTRTVLSGAIARIAWDIASPGQTVYPSAIPDAGTVSTAIGNNNPEALSAYLDAVENDASTSDPDSAVDNLEWLLNALQFGRLPSLGSGEIGVGQLDEYVHARSFGSRAGGCLWSVRRRMTPGSKATHTPPVEVTLPLPLARVLSQLNDRQQRYDAASDEIAARRQKLFFDWCYHIRAIETHVVEGGAGIGSDTSGALLLDGLVHLFPCMISAGTSGRIDAHGGPYAYVPEPLRIAAPGEQYTALAEYPFNASANTRAAGLVTQLLDLLHAFDGALPIGVDALTTRLTQARRLLAQALEGGTTAASYLGQAIAAAQSAQVIAVALRTTFAQAADPAGGLTAIEAALAQDAASLSAIVDPDDGVLATFLGVHSSDPVPTPPGQVYAGTMSSFEAFGHAASWAPAGAFKGIGDLIDQLTGQGAYAPHLMDTQLAGLYVASAFFWRQSGVTAVHSVPYYLQLAGQEAAGARSDAASASAALRGAIAALTGTATVAAVGASLDTLASVVLPRVVTALSAGPAGLSDAREALDAIAGDDTSAARALPWPLPAIAAAVTGDDWKTFVAAIDTAAQTVLNRLPLAHQVSLLGTFLHGRLERDYELGTAPGPAYWQPNEPVLLLAQPEGAADLIKPVDRNGSAPLLPCRWDSEILGPVHAVEWPDGVSRIASAVDPAIGSLAPVLQRLVEEAWVLDSGTPPADLTGTRPYEIAWTAWAGYDAFLPLLIFWQAEYVYSQRVDFEQARVPSDYLNDFTLDQFLVGYQPEAASLAHFQKDPDAPNYFGVYGLTSLSSAATANLSDQIRTYCRNTFDYDPSTGPPDAAAPDYAERRLFYDGYTSYANLNVLSQALGGFNARLRQRAQELQLPLNVPALWVDPGGNGVPRAAFWATQFLFNQSADWPASWAGDAIDFNAFARGDTAVSFSPLRAGFLKLQNVTVVDVFGRFAALPDPNPAAVAETLRSAAPGPLADHPVYLPPRLVQPSRVAAEWISATSPDGIGRFTEWNPHPAASPICGWLLPNHLDGSLALYNADGVPLGSLAPFGQELRWFTVPGEPYASGIDNRTLMLDDLSSRHANPAMQSFLEAFAYDAGAADNAANIQALLGVMDRAQQFIITKSMHESRALAVLIGQPLVLARISVRLQLRGQPDVSLDARSFPLWNMPGPQFEMDGSGFVPYNFGNFNAGGIEDLDVPLRVGAVEYQKNGRVTPYFDDGLVGFFVNDDYSTFYTPVAASDAYRIKSTAAPGSPAARVTPNGDAVTLTLLLDPRAPVHLTTGLLPVTTARIPPDQYAAAIARMQVTFLSAPLLQRAEELALPVPPETGYEWAWWQVGQDGDRAVREAQRNTDAVFSASPQTIVDGWLKLKKSPS